MKKSTLRGALGALLAIALLAVTVPISPGTAAKVKTVPTAQNRNHIKRGSDVGRRVRDLQTYNKDVRAALAKFDKNGNRNGNKPKLDEAVSVIQTPAGGPAALNRPLTAPSPFQKAGLKPQDPDYSEYGVEMILIPTFYDDDEWQGTIILNGFDPSGNYLGQYISDVAMAVDSTQTWDVFYESAFYGGQGYLLYGNPNFEVGTPRDSQDPSFIEPLMTSIRRPEFRKASFSPMAPQAPFGGPPGGIFSRPKVRWVMKCTAIGSAGIGVRCGIVSIFFAGGPFLPCAGAGAAGVFTVCTLTAIFY